MDEVKIVAKVVFVGDFKASSDEGMRNISQAISNEIERHHDVLRIQTDKAWSLTSLIKVSRFSPNIVHYLTGPTIRSLGTLFFYKLLFKDISTISSATRPFFSPFQYRYIHYLKPDLILTQDPRWEQQFIQQKANTWFLPNLIDLARFKPVDERQKKLIRKKYNLPEDGFLVFHAGHIRKNRNLEVFELLQNTRGIQVVIAGSKAFNWDKEICQRLKDAGCIILNTFIPNIQELYACMNMYVFPAIFPKNLPTSYNQVGVIDMPLSVLEAMATNLPVLSTAIPALQRIFLPDNGLLWFDGSAADCVIKLEEVRGAPSATREKVIDLDKDVVISNLNEVYAGYSQRH